MRTLTLAAVASLLSLQFMTAGAQVVTPKPKPVPSPADTQWLIGKIVNNSNLLAYLKAGGISGQGLHLSNMTLTKARFPFGIHGLFPARIIYKYGTNGTSQTWSGTSLAANNGVGQDFSYTLTCWLGPGLLNDSFHCTLKAVGQLGHDAKGNAQALNCIKSVSGILIGGEISLSPVSPFEPCQNVSESQLTGA